SPVVALPRLKCPASTDSSQQFGLRLWCFPCRLLGVVDGNAAAYHGFLQLRCALLEHHSGALDRALADARELRRLLLRRHVGKIAYLALSVLEHRQPGRHHGALGKAEVTAG